LVPAKDTKVFRLRLLRSEVGGVRGQVTWMTVGECVVPV
jgi:hypothetical protein